MVSENLVFDDPSARIWERGREGNSESRIPHILAVALQKPLQ